MSSITKTRQTKRTMPRFNIELDEQIYISITINSVFYDINNSNFNATQINEFLYLGDRNDANNMDALREKHIKHIINMANECEIEQQNVSIINLGINDDPDEENIHTVTTQAVRYINDCVAKGEIVMVVCKVGVSRSVTIVIAFLIECEKMTYENAFNYVKDKRPIISPNFGFCNFLRRLSDQIHC